MRTVETRIQVLVDGNEIAAASASSDNCDIPEGWIAAGRRKRDSDLAWWFEEAANVWLEGIEEMYQPPPPKQEGLF